jgi:hypothetical protein
LSTGGRRPWEARGGLKTAGGATFFARRDDDEDG